MHHPLGRAPAKCLNFILKKEIKRERCNRCGGAIVESGETIRTNRGNVRKERERKNERGIGREGEREIREYGEREC